MLNEAIRNLDGLDEVERVVKSKFASESPSISEISIYLHQLGGKRIRPILCLLAARALGMTKACSELIDVAAGIELIHMATLLHDDIIDKSPVRRHRESPFKKFGVNNTLLTGDFLLTRAFSLCAHLDTFIIEETERACIALTEGEIDEIPLNQMQHSLSSSLAIARKKTASLFTLACVVAAHLSKSPPEVVELMRVFGENLGISFQILDDILDATSDENLLGKKSGMDLAERKPSVVNVLWLESASALSRHLLTNPEHDELEFVKLALAELRGGQVVAQAKKIAQDYARTAQTALTNVNELRPLDPEATTTLRSLVEFTLARLG